MSTSTATIDEQPTHWPVRELLVLLCGVVAVVILVAGVNWVSTDSSTKAGTTPSLTTQPTTECMTRIRASIPCATF
jgi:hypothetical protein